MSIGLASLTKRLEELEQATPSRVTQENADKLVDKMLKHKQQADYQTQTVALQRFERAYVQEVGKRIAIEGTGKVNQNNLGIAIHTAVRVVEEWAPRLMKILGITVAMMAGFKLQTAIDLVETVMPEMWNFITNAREFIAGLIDEVVAIKNEIWKANTTLERYAPEPIKQKKAFWRLH